MTIKPIEVAAIIVAVGVFIKLTDGTKLMERLSSFEIDPVTKHIRTTFGQNAIEA